MTTVAKITAKGQTTIPREIRLALKVKAGDLIAWEVAANGHVEVRRVQPTDMEYLRALEGTMSEWTAPEDEKAYRDL
ncbi:MAG: type II toxin-antitoxin system PrlF family antitoxin [Nitrospinae bacterium]|nr:type II toxin-antitoxin system PrlF family antitoxin [Nitrospinota bacterium]